MLFVSTIKSSLTTAVLVCISRGFIILASATAAEVEKCNSYSLSL